MTFTRRKMAYMLAGSILARREGNAATTPRRLVVAGSENQTAFAIVDFTNTASLKLTPVDPGFGAGVRVALSDSAVAAGSVLSGAVRLVDLVSSPSPILRGVFQTHFSGIGAIAIRGHLVAAGEYVNSYKARVCVIDFTNPDAPVLVVSQPTPLISIATAPDKTSVAITNIVFLSDTRIAISGASDFLVIEMDFGNPNNPQFSTLQPRLGPPVLDADSAKGLLVVGDSGGRLVKVFSTVTSGELSSIPTSQASINSLSVSSAGFALASGSYSFTLDKVDLIRQTSSAFRPGLGGGLVTAVDELSGACGEIGGSRIALLDLNGVPRTIGVMDSGLPSISTLAIGTVAVPSGISAPVAVATPQSVVFPMTLLTSTANLTIANTGGATLNIRNIVTSDSHFSASSSALDVSPGGSQMLTLKFASSKGGGQFKATLSMTTNDPTHPAIVVVLSCIVGVH